MSQFYCKQTLKTNKCEVLSRALLQNSENENY